MEKPKEIRAFKSLDPYLHILRAYNSENFCQTNRLYLLKNIGFACVTTIFSSLLPIIIVLATWWLLDRSGVIQHVIVIAPIILTLVQMFIKYMALTMKNRVISETIKRLQNAIDTSRYSSIITNYIYMSQLSHVINILLTFVKGCKNSEQSYHIYQSVEKKHISIAAVINKVCYILIVITFTGSAMFPISHAIFGYPPPELWALPFPIQ